MNKLKFLTLATLALSLAFTSCEDTGTENPGNGNGTPAPTPDPITVSLATMVTDPLTEAVKAKLVEAAFTVELGEIQDEDVVVVIGVDNPVLDGHWQLVVNNAVVADNKITIPAGLDYAGATLRINSFALPSAAAITVPVEVAALETPSENIVAGDGIAFTYNPRFTSVVLMHTAGNVDLMMDADGNVGSAPNDWVPYWATRIRVLMGNKTDTPTTPLSVTLTLDTTYQPTDGRTAITSANFAWPELMNPVAFTAGVTNSGKDTNMELKNLDPAKDYVLPVKIASIEGNATNATEGNLVLINISKYVAPTE